MKKSQIISLLITLGATLDTIWGVIDQNQGLIVELGIPVYVTKIIMLLGLIYAAFSKSLKPIIFGDDIAGGGGKVPPPTK